MGDISDQLEQTHSHAFADFSDDTVWMTNNGECLTMEEITDQHLTNIIRWLKKQKSDCLTYRYSSLYSGTHSKEQNFHHAENEKLIDQYQSQISLFEKEAKKRGVKHV